jgi:hypothetical protein
MRKFRGPSQNIYLGGPMKSMSGPACLRTAVGAHGIIVALGTVLKAGNSRVHFPIK